MIRHFFFRPALNAFLRVLKKSSDPFVQKFVKYSKSATCVADIVLCILHRGMNRTQLISLPSSFLCWAGRKMLTQFPTHCVAVTGNCRRSLRTWICSKNVHPSSLVFALYHLKAICRCILCSYWQWLCVWAVFERKWNVDRDDRVCAYAYS